MPNRVVRKIRSSMSAKIALIVTVPVVLVTSAFSFYHYYFDREMIFRNAQGQLLRVAEAINGPVETHIKRNEPDRLQETVEDGARGADVKSVTVINHRGRILSSSDREWSGRQYSALYPERMTVIDLEAVERALLGKYSVYYDPLDSQYCLVMPLYAETAGEKRGGAMHISLDITSAEDELMRRMIDNMVLSVAGSLLMGVSIYFLFHYLFARRIRTVSGAAMKLASGDLQARAGAKGTDEIGYLATSFDLLAEEITNWRTNLETMVNDRVKELSTLFEISHMIGQSLDLSVIMPRVLNHVLVSLQETKGVIVLTAVNGGNPEITAHQGLSDESLQSIAQFGHGGVGDAILKNSALRIHAAEDESQEAVAGLSDENLRSVLAVPISTRGSAFGAIAVYSGRKERFTDQDEALLLTIGSQVAVAVENARLYEKTLAMAREDGLTGLANRRHLMEQLTREVNSAVRYHTALSVLVLDLDKFKTFNDTYGHLKGDELLRRFSALIKGMIRKTDIAGRYGGEEFAVILPNTGIKGAIAIAERIRSAAENLKIATGGGGAPVGRTVSIGIAELSPEETEEQLLANADASLYRAKQDGRNRVSWTR